MLSLATVSISAKLGNSFDSIKAPIDGTAAMLEVIALVEL